MTCLKCGGQLPPGLLACPSCHALVHATELKSLASSAEAAFASHQYSDALSRWRRMLDLLPPETSQHAAIKKRVEEVSHNLDQLEATAAAKKPKWAQVGGIVGVVALFLWKFKFLVVLILSKAKLLLLGLTKMSTVFSMLLSMGLYWTVWGWKFAVGFVLAIYVHEMGHIYQLRRYGIPATAPMFIPGIGAHIRLRQYPATPHEEAVTGLAGPVWGLGATVILYLIHLATNAEIFAALAKVNAWMNLFNLLPVWQLDGSHAMKALTKIERAGITALMVAMWLVTGDGLLILLFVVAAFRIFGKDAAQKRDLPIFTEFAVLLIALSLFAKIDVKVNRPSEQKPPDKSAAVQWAKP